MNFFKRTPQSFFCFDESASGTGGASSPPGGTASTPAATPSSAPAPAATPNPSPDGGTPAGLPSADAGAGASPAEEHDIFAGLGMDFGDLDEVVLPGQPPVTKTGTAPPAAAPAPAATPVPAPSAQPVAPVSGQQPAPAPAAPTATAPTSPRDQLRQTVDGFKNNSAQLAQWAGNELFRLSDEEVTALTTDAPSAIPAIAGRVYAQSLAASANLIQNLVPALVEQMIEQQHGARTRATEAMSEFWAAHKDLNAKDHGALVTAWAKQFRAANPQATRAEAIAFVGRAVRMQAGIAQPAAASAQPAAPSAPQAFAPARPGGRTPIAPTPDDPFWGLDKDFDESGAPIS